MPRFFCQGGQKGLLIIHLISSEIADEILRTEDPGWFDPNLIVTLLSLALLVIGAQFFVVGAVDLWRPSQGCRSC